ncbi:MAG: hypothetical protein Q7J16_00270 [Candidatus Cloacimonadales bacterium]|nr:hypothetical protein [Candidatus Cloacimonadales bacterium]
MTQREILEQLNRLPTVERLTIIQAALHLIHKDLQEIELPSSRAEKARRLAAAAEALLPDYSAGGELTAFTALDHEVFHAER